MERKSVVSNKGREMKGGGRRVEGEERAGKEFRQNGKGRE